MIWKSLLLLGVFLISFVVTALVSLEVKPNEITRFESEHFIVRVSGGSVKQGEKLMRELEYAREIFSRCPTLHSVTYPRKFMVVFFYKRLGSVCGGAYQQINVMRINLDGQCDFGETVAHELLHLAGINHKMEKINGRMADSGEQEEMETCYRRANQ